MSKSQHKILVLVGPSGVGKSYLVKQLQHRFPNTFKLVLSTTTRSSRPGEKNMVDMHFVSDEEYVEYQKNGEFFSDFNNFNAKYGYLRSSVTSIQEEGLIPVAIVYTTIVPYYYKEFPGNVFSIFLYPTDLNLLEHRMRVRGDSEDSIQNRLLSCKKEINDYETVLKDSIDYSFPIAKDGDIEYVIKCISDKYDLKP